jgi:uncharacterized protein (TIGR03083 family)
MSLPIPKLIVELRIAGNQLAEAAEVAGLHRLVPTCPLWTVRDLVRHTGSVHRWATTIVREARTTPLELTLLDDVPDVELIDWFRAGHADLVDALTTAPADLEAWTFLGAPSPSPLHFWARRQAHETIIHRVDAEFAAQSVDHREITKVDKFVASDGVEELLMGFVTGRAPKLRNPEEPWIIHVHVQGAPGDWLIHLGDHEPWIESCGGDISSHTMIGAWAWDMYGVLWNRLPWEDAIVTGEESFTDLWRDGVKIS